MALISRQAQESETSALLASREALSPKNPSAGVGSCEGRRDRWSIGRGRIRPGAPLRQAGGTVASLVVCCLVRSADGTNSGVSGRTPPGDSTTAVGAPMSEGAHAAFGGAAGPGGGSARERNGSVDSVSAEGFVLTTAHHRKIK